MIEISLVETIPNYFPWESHALHDLESVFVHVHCCKILSDCAVVGVREFCLVAIVNVEKIVNLNLINVWFLIWTHSTLSREAT